MDRGFRELASARFAQSWSRSRLDRRICLGALEHITFDITEVTFAILQNIETDRPPEKVELRYGRHQRIPIAVGKLDAIPTPEWVEEFLAETLEHALVLQKQVPCSFATLVRDNPGRIILFRPVCACPIDHAKR